MKKRIKLLIITRNAWSDNISTGNTMTNFFSSWSGEIANLYCRNEKIKNSICKKYFRVTENDIIKNILHAEHIGTEIDYQDEQDNFNDISERADQRNSAFYGFFRQHRFIIFLWMRELIWKLSTWKNKKLQDFVKTYNPDIIMIPLYECVYMYDILFFVRQYTQAKIVLYTGDDVYTMKQFSLSPLYWINRLMVRKKIRQAVKISDLRMCLTDKQSLEYTNILKKEFVTVMKGGDFSEPFFIKQEQTKNCINIVYTGNILQGRYQVLSLIGEAIHRINGGQKRMQLHIYSANLLNKKMKCTLLKYPDSVVFHGKIDSEQVKQVQKNADILLHAENFKYVDRLAVRLSLSTKIVDYLAQGKCIFAVGPADVASVDYLIKNDAAVVATDRQQIEDKLRELIENPGMICEYGKKAWDCGKRNHQTHEIQRKLYQDFEELVYEGCAD